MRKLILFIFLCTITGNLHVQAQDTLPKFSVKNIGANRIVIGWKNTFETITQINIQRSFDSLKNFKTILSVTDPSTPENGYVDTKASNDHMFYRLYIQLDKGAYIFSDAKRPVWDTAAANIRKIAKASTDSPLIMPVIGTDSSFTIPGLDNKNKPKADLFIPSKNVYTLKDGDVRISLPGDADKKYSIKFFTNDGELLFELKDLKEKSFKLDKANLYRSGWFKFELYENGELLEKNKFFLPKEF